MITNKNQACFTKKSGCGLQEELHTPFPFTIIFRTKDHVLDLTSPIKKSKMVEGKHGGQRDGKRGKRE